jgi:Gluconate 2-dehydrogenase subunit 3
LYNADEIGGRLESAPITPVGDARHSRQRLPPLESKRIIPDVPKLQWNRRAFLQAALATTAAAGTGVACCRNENPWRFLTLDEARTLAAMSDQIIPPDQAPGASWAGVVNYIDRQLCGPYQNLQSIYRRGLAGVDQSSRTLYGKFFAALDSSQQIDLLHQLEDRKAPGAI